MSSILYKEFELLNNDFITFNNDYNGLKYIKYNYNEDYFINEEHKLKFMLLCDNYIFMCNKFIKICYKYMFICGEKELINKFNFLIYKIIDLEDNFKKLKLF